MKKSVYLFLAFLTLIMIFVPNFTTSAKDSVIYIDPGHGGFDGGCVGLKLVEKDLTLDISLRLRKYLESVGYKVLLTREKDMALYKTKSGDIYKRVSLINNQNTLLYISIHANFYPHNAIKGAQTFYKDSIDNKLLARLIQENLKRIDLENKRVEKTITGKYLLDNVLKVGCLVEVGFLSNRKEEEKLCDNFYKDKIAYAIFIGVLSYLESI